MKDLAALPLDESVLSDYLLSFDYFTNVGRAEEGRRYCDNHLHRYVETIRLLLPHVEPGARVLELGASPYFMTLIMMRHLGCSVDTANFFGDYGQRDVTRGVVTIESKKYDERYTFDHPIFNVEFENYPYPDDSYDVVVCCEMLEHLAGDPTHLVREVHRILKPNGVLVLTTPNAVRLEKVYLMLRGENVFEPYSGDGVYGRHNREYTKRELEELLRANNFEPKVIAHDAYHHGVLNRVFATLLPGRRDNLFVLARAHGADVQVRPEWLFWNAEARVHVTRPAVIMGERDHLQLGPGWNGYENRPPPMRWTTGDASAYLLYDRPYTHLRIQVCGGPFGSRCKLDINGRQVADGDLVPDVLQNLEFPIPPDVVEELLAKRVDFMTVRIRVANPMLPVRDLPGSDDPRELGIVVTRIELVGLK